MKYYNLLLIAIPLYASCGNEQLDLENVPALEATTLTEKVIVKPSAGNTVNDVFNIGTKDLLKMLTGKKHPATRAGVDNSYTIEPIIYDGDTIMYLSSTQAGWKLYSVDKRMPVVLAENMKTSMTAEKLLENQAISIWIEQIADQVKYLKKSPKYDTQSESLQEWAQYDRQLVRTASDEYNPDENDWIPYEVEELGSEVIYRDHLLPTAWHQSPPFNSLAPYKSTLTGERCPAGCGPVAVAQFLFYMSRYKQLDIKMPTTGYSYGPNDNFFISFSDMAHPSTYEPALTDNYYLYTDDEFKLAALMIGYMGYKLGTKYGDNGSSTSISDLRGYLDDIGIKTAFEDVSESKLHTLREMSYPSIMYAASDKGSHAWVCDGGKYTIEHYNEVWANISDSAYWANGNKLPPGTAIKKIKKTRLTNQLFLMNWGWNNYENPNFNDVDYTYYSIRGEWEADLKKDRKMIYTAPYKIY